MGNRVRWSGFFGLALMFGIPIFICGGGVFLKETVFQEEGLLPGGLFGIPAQQWMEGFTLVALILCILGFIFALPLSGMVARRRMRAAYKPQLDERLRKFAGRKRWGAFANVSVFRTIPRGERSLPLSQLPE